jgi:hypothetical protein
MILRPEQVRLLAAGLPATPANKDSESSSSSNTTNNYADKRNAVQGGVGISGDGNRTSTTINTLDGGAVTAGIGAANNAVSSMADVSKSVVGVSSHLSDVALGMLQANNSLTEQLSNGLNSSQQAVTQIASQLASTQIAAQNDNRYLIAAGMAVVAIVGFAAFSKGKA